MIRKQSKLVLVLGLSLSIFIGGCATTGSSLLGGSSADSRLTSGSDAEFFSKSGYQACAAGAAIGVAACLLTSSSNKAACAIVAGVAACGVAMGANYYLDDRRSKYANTNERLQAITADVQADTERIILRTQTAQNVINDDKAHMQRLQKQIAANEIDNEAAEKELAQIDQNIAILQRDLKNMKSKADEYTKVVALEREDGVKGPSINQLDRQIEEMNNKIALLEEEVEFYYTQRNAITLG